MIDFDRKTLAILRCIKHSRGKGVSWGTLQKRYGEDAANPFLLEDMSKELYTATKDCDGKWINFEEWDRVSDYRFRSYSTPKGNELIERRCFDFWKWIIPTLISVVALVISFIGLLR